VADHSRGVFRGADRSGALAAPMMRATIAVAAILPVLALILKPPLEKPLIAKPLPERPLIEKPVITEPVRAVRQDADTFRLRWFPVADLPPAAFIRYVNREPVAPAVNREPEPELEPVVRAERPRSIRRASLDICARHNMRKVSYGRTWRCRR
jgi:hypothetical protein